jgi:flagellar motor switch protein FliN/FliY
MMTNNDNNTVTRRFVQRLGEALAEALTGAAGIPWKLAILESFDAAAQSGSPVIFSLTFEGMLRGVFFIEFRDPQVKVLADAIRGHGLQSFDDEDGEPLRTAISTAMTRFCASLFAEYGTVTGKVERVANPAIKDLLAIPLAAQGGNSSPMPLMLYLDSKLIESISSWPVTKAAAEPEGVQFDPVNLNLVLDVELSMSLRFGVRRLPLREVLELASGSVVELDRQVDDPVELLLDGRVIARGEAVIVDGNYGLRVTEITEPIASNFVR